MPQEFVAHCKLKGDARINLRAAVFAGALWLFAPTFAFAGEMMPGVESMVVETFQRLLDPDPAPLGAGALPMGRLEIARLDNDPSFRERGVLTISVRGGK